MIYTTTVTPENETISSAAHSQCSLEKSARFESSEERIVLFPKTLEDLAFEKELALGRCSNRVEFPSPDQIINILFGALKQLRCFGGSDNPLLDKSHEILLRQGDNFASLIKCAVRDGELIPPANAISTYLDTDLAKIGIVFQQGREGNVRSESRLQLTAFNQTVAEKNQQRLSS